MRNLLFSGLVLLLALATSCSLLLPPAKQAARAEQQAARKVAALVAAHPGLQKPDTVKVPVPFYVPRVQFKIRYLAQLDTVRQQQEQAQLDMLINQLRTSLDSAASAATKAKLHQLLDSRPVLRDTLCFDTLGVAGKIWLSGRTYQVQIVRAPVVGTVTGSAVVSRLAPCPPMPAALELPWYNPESWALPWYLWLLIGIVTGLILVLLFFLHLTRAK